MIFVYYVESDFKELNIRVQIWRQWDYDYDDNYIIIYNKHILSAYYVPDIGQAERSMIIDRRLIFIKSLLWVIYYVEFYLEYLM